MKAAVESCKSGEMNKLKSTRDGYYTEMANTQYNTIRLNDNQLSYNNELSVFNCD